MKDLYYAYKDARNLSWRILINQKLFEFPIDIKNVVKKLGFLVIEVDQLPHNLYAVSFAQNSQTVIAYVSSGNINTDRFTIAHELGHLLLRHKADKEYSEYQEEQANIFASRLLAPMIVINDLAPNSVEELANFFGISLESANIRYNRYLEIKQRDKFLTSTLEREYYNLYQSRSEEHTSELQSPY